VDDPGHLALGVEDGLVDRPPVPFLILAALLRAAADVVSLLIQDIGPSMREHPLQ
jgi:hypothetical protein